MSKRLPNLATELSGRTGGDAGGIVGIHEWTLTDVPEGVEVRTRESFAGAPVMADAPRMQALLDASLVSWLRQLKSSR